MPATVGGYHLFQYCLGAQPDEAIRFEELETDLGSGFGTATGFGIDTGIRRFVAKFPTLPGAVAQATISYKGTTLTPADYLWALFCDSKVSGEPLVVQSPRNDQYYLVRFADRELTYARMLTKLFSTGLELKQFRIEGTSVFDMSKLGDAWTWLQADSYVTIVDFGTTFQWTDLTGQAHFLSGTSTANLTHVADVKNHLSVFRFNADTSPDGFFNTTLDPVIYEAFLVMKMREATFSDYAGILTADTGTAALLGDNGTTQFFNQSIGSPFEYRKNGIVYPESNMQAPMNEFAVVHLRFSTGIGLANLQIGKDRAATDRYAKMDLGEVLLVGNKPLAGDVAREVTEDLITRWDL